MLNTVPGALLKLSPRIFVALLGAACTVTLGAPVARAERIPVPAQCQSLLKPAEDARALFKSCREKQKSELLAKGLSKLSCKAESEAREKARNAILGCIGKQKASGGATGSGADLLGD